MANTWVYFFIDSAVVRGNGSVSVGGVLRDQHEN